MLYHLQVYHLRFTIYRMVGYHVLYHLRFTIYHLPLNGGGVLVLYWTVHRVLYGVLCAVPCTVPNTYH